VILSELHRCLEACGLDPAEVTPAVHAHVAGYLELRAQWAQVHNLSGPAALRTPWEVDVVDAVATCAVLRAEATLVDVGTGSGVPGLLVACIRPQQAVRLVEPLAKRTAFLRATAQKLGLGNVVVHRDRWPLTSAERRLVPDSETWQVISRAVVSPETWPELAASGGPAVVSVLRMLAAQRPDCTLTEHRFAVGLDYAAQGNSRRIERWDR
jgi:16S rRNA G527 N7-methylase RsmG